jgi:hypothetical protein
MTKQVRDVLDKLDRIELFLADARLDEKPGTFPWLAILDAGLSVRACRRQVEAEGRKRVAADDSGGTDVVARG